MSETDYSSQPADEDLDFEAPLLTPSHCHSLSSSEIVNRCAVCSNRQQRSRLVWALCLVWAVPLALAAGKCYGLWGQGHRTTRQQPQGQLKLVQVIFRHGARTPLSNMYWPDTNWTNCSQHPLQPSALQATTAGSNPFRASSSSNTAQHTPTSSDTSMRGIHLQLYDPSGAPTPPELSGDEEPQLPGGCRMGALTDNGFLNALDLGAQLRQRYIDHQQLLPSSRLDTRLLHAESTAVQRTVTTLRGVLAGLYPNSSGAVRVAVRPYEQELMTADWQGCPMLGNLTAQLTQLQQDRDASDPKLKELEHLVRTGLQLPEAAPLLYSRLRDELACLAAEGAAPPAAAAQAHLLARIDYTATQHKVETSAPETGHCLLGRDHQQQCQQVTALTTGRLLHQLLHNMQAAATSRSTTNSTHDNSTRSRSSNAARRLMAPTLNQDAPIVSSSSSSDGEEEASSAARPTMVLLSAHDTTLLPLLTALGQQQTTWPGFASYLAFELWEHKGKHSVRVLHDGEPLRLPLTPADTTGLKHNTGDRSGWLIGIGSRKVAALWQQLTATLREWAAAAWSVFERSSKEDSAAAGRGWWGLAFWRAHGQIQRLGSNGEGVYMRTQYVVSVDDFKQRVVQDYLLSPKEYGRACGGSGAGAGLAEGGARAGRQWHAQFY